MGLTLPISLRKFQQIYGKHLLELQQKLDPVNFDVFLSVMPQLKGILLKAKHYYPEDNKDDSESSSSMILFDVDESFLFDDDEDDNNDEGYEEDEE